MTVNEGILVLEGQHSGQLLEFGYLTLGAVILATGLVALLLSILRREHRDPTLMFFGGLSVLTGLHFLVDTDMVHFIACAAIVALLILSDPKRLDIANDLTIIGVLVDCNS